MAAEAPVDRPLPTTRELGEEHGVANTTVYRVLRTMAEAGEIWQHPTNGRYYPAGARALLDRPKPVACLIRRLELASALYRELLEGISAGCGERHRTVLLWHDELLVNHPEPHEPPVFASVVQQRAILSTFLDRHGDAAGGFLLDHVWSDEALQTHAARLRPAVVLFRSCDLPGFSNVRADFRGGALKALAHLLGRGFEQIVPIEPFSGDPAVAEFGTALDAAAGELDCRARLAPVARATTARERANLIERLRKTTRRTALLCPEDNVAVLLAKAARDEGLRCPERVGVLSVMGTDLAVKEGISCLRYDFRALGRRAVEALSSAQSMRHVIEPQFSGGATT
jgi:DNA-binding LacI/PurR family transcriptional regulator